MKIFGIAGITYHVIITSISSIKLDLSDQEDQARA